METNWNNWNNLFTNWNNYYSHSWPKLISLFSFVSLKTEPTYFLHINEKFVLKEQLTLFNKISMNNLG